MCVCLCADYLLCVLVCIGVCVLFNYIKRKLNRKTIIKMAKVETKLNSRLVSFEVFAFVGVAKRTCVWLCVFK